MNACLSEELQSEQVTLQKSRDDFRALWGFSEVVVPAWGVCTSWISQCRCPRVNLAVPIDSGLSVQEKNDQVTLQKSGNLDKAL